MRKKKIIVSVVIAVLLVILIVGILIWGNYIADGKKKELVNKSGNESFNMTGFSNNFMKYGDCIIFSNGNLALNAEVSNYEDGIYKYNIKTGQVIQLSTSNGYCLNLRNSTLYYISTTGQINTVNVDTLEKNWISGIGNANYLLIYDDYVYYRDSNGNNIYRTNDMHGNNKQLIAEYSDGDIQIKNNYIYYLDAQNLNLFKKSIDDLKEEESKIIDESISQFYCIDDKIVYLSDNQLKVYNMQDGSSEILVEKNIASNFVIKDRNVYFYLSDDKSLNKLDLDTLEVSEISSNLNEIYRLQLFDNYIFYYDSENNSSIFTGLTIKTLLYYIDLTDNKQEELYFNTKV